MLDLAEAPTAEVTATTETDRMTALATIPSQRALAFFTTEGAADKVLAQLRKELDAFVPDISTASGRAAIASIAHKVARSKTLLDEAGKELVAKLKEQPKKVDATRKHIRDTLDGWKAEVRKPLTDWEAAEDDRIQNHLGRIRGLANIPGDNLATAAVDVLRGKLLAVESITIDEASCEEFLAEYAIAKDASVRVLKAAIPVAEKRDAEAAELSRLRAEDAVRKERERVEAEAQAAGDREEAIRAEAATKAAEAERAASAQREAALQAQAEQARRDQAEAERRAELAQAQAQRLTDEAKAAEARQASERIAANEEAKLRASDVEHRRVVNAAAMSALLDAGIHEQTAKRVISLIVAGKVPRVAITY